MSIYDMTIEVIQKVDIYNSYRFHVAKNSEAKVDSDDSDDGKLKNLI